MSAGSANVLEQARLDQRKREAELADEFGDEFAARIEVREGAPRRQDVGDLEIAFETAAHERAAKRARCTTGAFRKRLRDEEVEREKK